MPPCLINGCVISRTPHPPACLKDLCSLTTLTVRMETIQYGSPLLMKSMSTGSSGKMQSSEKKYPVAMSSLPCSYDIHIINALYDSGVIDKDRYIICNGFKRPQYVENIAQLINDGFENT